MDNVDERRLPQGGSPQESWYQDWPAANDPQTPPVPGAKRPRRTSVTTGHGAHEASAPEPAPAVGDRPRSCGSGPTRDQRANSRRETACLAGKKKEPRRAVSGLVAGIPPFGGLPTLAFTYTLRPSLDAPLARKRSTVPSRTPGGPLCMGWSVRWSILPYEVGHSGSPPTRAGRDLQLVSGGASCWLEPGGPTHPKPRGPRDRARAAVPPRPGGPRDRARAAAPPRPGGPR